MTMVIQYLPHYAEARHVRRTQFWGAVKEALSIATGSALCLGFLAAFYLLTVGGCLSVHSTQACGF